MAFQIKNFASIAASIINIMKATQTRVTDFNVGAIVRTMVEAVAAEIDELYQQMFIGLKEAIPVSVYNSFRFDGLLAFPSSGLVRVTFTSSASEIVIAAGTQFSLSSGAAVYLSNVDLVVAPGETFVDVLVTCDTAGSFSNIGAGQVFLVSPPVPGFISATNLSAFTSGSDAEDEDDRKSRFNAFISSLPRGTVAALKYGLNLANLVGPQGNITERVVASAIIEPWLTDENAPISLVNCYIHNGVGLTSLALVARAKEVIYGYYEADGTAVPGWKAAGVRVEVFAAIELAIDVAGEVETDVGYDHDTLVETSTSLIYSYILALGIGQAAIHAEMIAIIMGIEGVSNVRISSPSDDVIADPIYKLMPGSIAFV